MNTQRLATVVLLEFQEGENMRAVWILGTAALGALAIQWLLSRNRRPTLVEKRFDEKLHQLQGKFRSLDDVQQEAATTSGTHSGYPESLHSPVHP